MSKKRMNSYVRMILIMAVCALAGGFAGYGFFYLWSDAEGGVQTALENMMAGMQSLILPLMAVITILSVLLGEWNLSKLRTICNQVVQAQDEECDRWEYEEEKTGALGLNINILSQVLAILVLSLGYSVNYIASGESERKSFLYACIIFIICLAYDAFWQIRYVKLIQKAHPEKKGDPSSPRFQKQWLESCDEAERQIIYQSSYQTYMTMSKSIPILLIATMLSNLFLNTGIMAILVVAVIWLSMSISYTRSCVLLKGSKVGKIRA